MEKRYHSVKVDESLCKGCTTCMQHCPTEAIRIRDGKAHIDDRFCVDCGECIRVCQSHAKYAEYDKLDVLDNYEYTVALPAPSLYMQFRGLEDTSIILNALKEIGFNDIYEVSAAAELVSEETRKFLAEHDDGDPWISGTCPSVLRVISKRFPNLIERLIPVKPPVEVAAELAVKKAIKETGLSRDKIGIIFISPCPAKVTYAKNPIGVDKSEIDAVVALKDIYQKILPHMNAIAKTNYPSIGNTGKVGISWGARGGEATGLFITGFLAADGMDNVISVLDDIEDRKFKSLRFIELSACPGGCVGGALAVENPFVAEARLKRIRKYMQVTQNSVNDMDEKPMIISDTQVQYDAVSALGSSMEESFKLLGMAERIEKKLPGFDCGSCGAPNCKALAKDIALGNATENDCVYILKDKVHALKNEIISLNDEIKGLDNTEISINVIREYVCRLKKEFKDIDTEK